MPTGWTQVPLESLAVEGSVTYGVVQPGQAVADGVPMVRVNNFRGFGLDTSDVLRISADVEAKYARTRLRADDVLVTVVGTVGQVAVVPHWLAGWNVARAVAVIRPRDARLTRWIALALRAPESQRALGVAANTTVQTTINLKDLRKLPVPLPEPNEREAIELLLGSLDDRIDLLRQTNATLEAIAQALFKSWFIDFDPVRAKAEGRDPEGMDSATAALFPSEFEESPLGLTPKGWEVAPIGDLVEAVGGSTPDTKNPTFWEPAVHHWTSPKDLSGATSPVLLDTERKVSPAGLAKISSGLLPAGSLLMSSRAPIGYLALTQVPVAINQGYIAMLPGGQLPPLYLYFWCKANMEGIKGRANGSTFMEISKKAFRPIPALLPPPDIVSEFVAVAGALFDRLVANERTALSLTDVRDTLLPRLISGKLRLPEAQARLEEAIA